MQEFLSAFVAAAVGSGFVLGMLTWLVARDQGLKTFERWIAERDQRLHSLRITLLQRTAARLLGPISRVGAEAPAVALGVLYVATSAFILWSTSSSWYPPALATLRDLELIVDPKLARFSEAEVKMATEVTIHYLGEGMSYEQPVHTGPPFVEIRERIQRLDADVASVVRARRDVYPVTLALLIKGNRYTETPALGTLLVLAISPAIVEFLAILAAFAILKRLSQASGVWSASCWTVLLPALWMICSVSMMLIYRLVLSGSGVKLLLIPLWVAGLPILLVALPGSVLSSLAMIAKWPQDHEPWILPRPLYLLTPAASIAASGLLTYALAAYNPFTELIGSIEQARSFPSPLWLGLIVGFPLILACLGFAVLTLGTIVGELGRWLLLSLHGWARNSGTTYVGMWVAFLSVAVGAAFGVLNSFGKAAP